MLLAHVLASISLEVIGLGKSGSQNNTQSIYLYIK